MPFQLNQCLRTMLPLLLLSALTLAATAQESAPGDSDPVARVGKKVITWGDFNQSLRGFQARAEGTPIDEDALKLRVLQERITTELLVAMAEQEGIEATKEDIAARISQAKESVSGEDAFNSMLELQGLTEAELEDSFRRQIITRKLIEQRTADIEVTEDEILKGYETLKAADKLMIADFAHILVRVESSDAQADEVAKEKIAKIRKRIVDEGEAFGEVARHVSEDPKSASRGGAYYRVELSKLPRAFQLRIKEAKLNEISEPFRTQAGYHILTVTGREERSYEDVAERISQSIYTAKRVQAINALVQDARKEIKVEVYADFGTQPNLDTIAPDTLDFGDLPEEDAL